MQNLEQIRAKHADDAIKRHERLSRRDSHPLQRATAEALAHIAYLKQFAPKD